MDPVTSRPVVRPILAALLAAVALAGATTPPASSASPRSVPPASGAAMPAAVSAAPVVPADRLAVGSSRPTTLTLTDDLRTALQRRLDTLRRQRGLPGVSAALLLPDGSLWVGTSGLADVAARRPVTPDTAFAMASVSKTFTAALVMSLVQDGRLSLDASVARWLPAFHLDPRITVRQLLDHTSGLRDFFFGRGIDAALLSAPTRRWDAATAMRYVGKPYFKPGRGWHYSNTNYLLLGALAERVGGAPLGEQLQRRFLGPLGLTGTSYQPSEAPPGPLAHGYRFRTAATDAPAIDLSDGTDIVPFTSVVTAAAGAGGVASTAADIARWARAVYGGDVLADTTVATMIADVTLTAPYRPSRPYGLGVQAVPIAGHQSLGHSGRFLGFQSVVRWLPDEDVTVAVLTNQSRTDPSFVARGLLATLFARTRSAALPAVR